MLRQEKYDFVANLEKAYQNSNTVIVTHYHGITMSQLTVLRQNLRKNGAEFKVVKNTLSKIALNNVGLSSLLEMFSGPVGIAYSSNPVESIKDIVNFNKANDRFKIIGGIIDNKVLNENEIRKIAKLPSINELRSKIVGILQAPACNIARILQASPVKLIRVLQAYSEK